MDAMDSLRFLRDVADGSVQLVVASSPYNIGKRYERKSPLEDYVRAQAQVISECVRALQPHGSLCWQVGNHVQAGEIFPLDIELYHVFKDHGLKLRNRIVWHFEIRRKTSGSIDGRLTSL